MPGVGSDTKIGPGKEGTRNYELQMAPIVGISHGMDPIPRGAMEKREWGGMVTQLEANCPGFSGTSGNSTSMPWWVSRQCRSQIPSQVEQRGEKRDLGKIFPSKLIQSCRPGTVGIWLNPIHGLLKYWDCFHLFYISKDFATAALGSLTGLQILA